jgi:hypothetical protein
MKLMLFFTTAPRRKFLESRGRFEGENPRRARLSTIAQYRVRQKGTPPTSAARRLRADLAKLIADETEKWAEVIKFAGIKAE